MNRIILFRFHKNPNICSSRISTLDKLNPDCKIIGIGDDINGLSKMFESGMDDFYSLEDYDSRWCWLNGDLAMLDWFKEEGHKYDFDMLHLIEWDLLITEPLDTVYKDINEIGLTGKISIEKAKEFGWNWALSDEYNYLRQKIGRKNDPAFACLFPGCCFSRKFIEDISEMNIPELCNDEARIGILAGKYDVDDTGFFDWNDSENPLFNCKNINPTRKQIINSDRSVFHPVRKNVLKN
jgi:hypothetical protein